MKSPRSLSTMPTAFPAINKRFKQTRKDAGMTQQVFADELGIGLSTVKAIETNIVVPNIYIIKQWKKKFKKSYDWIIDG